LQGRRWDLPAAVANLAIMAYIHGMTAIARDWTTTRKRCVRLCVPVLVVLAGTQVALSFEQSLPRLVAGLAYALACLAALWVLLERAEIVPNTTPLRWKILTWAVPVASGFAMVGHLLFGRVVEQAVLGGGCALVAVMSLFIAFSPDDADLVDNDQMTQPSKP